MKALTLKMDDGSSYVSIISDEEVNLDEWVEERYEGLQLLGVIRVELRDKFSKIVHWISSR